MANISERTLIDELLEEQRNLTAAEKFSRAHDRSAPHAHSKYYRDLIPMSLPKKGEQYAFEVDLDKCSGCKACVAACHSLNGLAENETWRSVGSLHGGDEAAPFQMTVTTACHHCVDPACSNGCPVLAYEKDSVTGIVRHLDDQCIGCQYCVLQCPYEVPQYHVKKGIVRKCDMCSSRLLVNEAPACVQSCPNEAIRITVVKQKEVVVNTTTGNQLVPSAPCSSLTIPTTRFKSSRDFPGNVQAGDASQLKPAKAHLPLVAMLILTQLSVGLFLFGAINESILKSGGVLFEKMFFATACGAGLAGIIASLFHLGRPLQAWRSFLGWRKSWLSREILLFGLFISLASFQAATHWVPGLPERSWLLPVVVGAGFVAVFSSVMVYASTRRAFWSLPRTSMRFFGSAVLLGLAGGITLSVNFTSTIPVAAILAVMLITLLKISWEAKEMVKPPADESLQRSARLQAGPLKKLVRARFVCGVMGGFVLPGSILAVPALAPVLAIAAFCFRFCGEALERHLFFVAAAPPKMPGGIGS